MLTFVTTLERFNLPKDIIARFNLKSKWVHEGLLLGTGPIVDPELKANLLIPLHNFSSQDVSLNYGDQIISVEFTKTLNPSDKLELLSGERSAYIKNKSRIFDFDKYRKRIGGKRVESSVSSKFDEYDKTIEGYRKWLTRFSWAGVITMLATLIGLIVLTYTTWDLISSARTQLDEASKIVNGNKNQSSNQSTMVSKAEFNALQNELVELRKWTEGLNLGSNMNPTSSSPALKNIKTNLNQKLKARRQRIDQVETRLEEHGTIEGNK